MSNAGDSAPRGCFFVLVGPAGAGKSSVSKELIKSFSPDLELSISATSRPPRPGEVPGEHYIFMTREDFERDRDSGKFFEWEETHGNFYGTPQQQIDNVLSEKSSLLLDIDIRGAMNFSAQFPQRTHVVLLIPPSAKVLVGRITRRGGVSDRELGVRLKTAEREVSDFSRGLEQGSIQSVIVNEDFSDTVEKVSTLYSCCMNGENGESIEQSTISPERALERLVVLLEEIKQVQESLT